MSQRKNSIGTSQNPDIFEWAEDIEDFDDEEPEL